MSENQRVAESVGSLRASLEGEYISGPPQLASEVYFELAILAVGKSEVFTANSNVGGLATPEDIEAAIKSAKQTLAYRIGERSVKHDNHQNNKHHLIRLADTVRKLSQ